MHKYRFLVEFVVTNIQHKSHPMGKFGFYKMVCQLSVLAKLAHELSVIWKKMYFCTTFKFLFITVVGIIAI